MSLAWTRWLERPPMALASGRHQQPRMFALFVGIFLCNLVVFLLLSQPFAFNHALWMTLSSVILTEIGRAHV